MALFKADAEGLAALTAELGRAAAGAHEPATAGSSLLVRFGYPAEATAVAWNVIAASGWAEAWSASLLRRIAILERGWVGTGFTPDGRRHGNPYSVYAVFIATPPSGRALATRLLDILDDHRPHEVRGLVDQLDGLAEADVVAFFETLGPDMLRLLPRILLEAGIGEADLALYLAPLGAALGIASRAQDGLALSFTGLDLMNGHEGLSVTPAVYFDFGVFHVDFLLAAAAQVLTSFAESELPKSAPDYQLPDGSRSGTDPRLPLLRGLVAMDAATQQGFVVLLARQGGMASLMAPATPWGDGGAAAEALLLSLVTTINPDTAAAVAAVVEAAAIGVPPPMALAAAKVIAPHLGSMVLSTWFGTHGVDSDEPELRAALATLPGAATTVSRFFEVLLAYPEAARLLESAFAALLASRVAAHLDPDDPESLAPIADDLGALWQMLYGGRLQVDLEAARTLDHRAGITIAILEAAISFTATGVGAVIAQKGFAKWALVALSDSGALEWPVSALIDTDNAERVLLEGYTAIEAAQTAAAVVLAIELQRRGVIELPPALLDEHGIPRLGSAADRQLLGDAFAAAGIDPTTWFNDLMAIFAYGLPTPQ